MRVLAEGALSKEMRDHIHKVIGEGQHFDKGKLRMDLIPPEAEEALAAVLTYGCNKYAERNWEGGIKFSRLYGSVRRHLHQWWGGTDIDPESELHHLKHALCNLAFLITYIERNMEEFDDRT
jgi:hypothetical protein